MNTIGTQTGRIGSHPHYNVIKKHRTFRNKKKNKMKVTMWGFYSGGNGNSIHWINPGSKITRRKNNNRRSRKINS